jgi:hypothetical protein
MRVKIKKIPNAAYGGQQSDGGLDVTPAAWGGSYSKAKQGKEVNKTLSKVPRSKANLEAEGGETAFGPISGDTIPDHMIIKGPRHTNGGVPLNLPEDTFIFSDTKSMRITDPAILKMFGKTRKKGGYTPAGLAKPYDINKYKAILMDPDSDRLDRENAELMIKNYIMKLGALALAQESKKGFPQGIPEMARPYMEANGISEEDLMPEQEQGEQPEMPESEMAEGGTSSPFEMSMEKAKEIDFTALSAPDLDNTFENTVDDPIKQEGTQGQDISLEVGIKNAYDVDGDMLANQGAYFASKIGNFSEKVKNSKKMKSIFDKSMDPNARENVFSGLHYANTPGVVAPSGVSPTTVQSYRSQFGGELDRFVYDEEESMAYGGTPMSLYGMEMGGSYYPTMSTGGTRRVKITRLPRKDNGGDGNVPTIKGAKSVSPEDYAASSAKEYTDPTTGEKFKYSAAGVKIVYDKDFRADVGTEKDPNILDKICAEMSREGSSYYGMNGKAALIASQMYAAGENHPNWESSVKYLDGCKVKGSGESEVKIRTKVVDNPKDCNCPEVDAEGNIVKNEDGSDKLIATGQKAVYNEESKKWECPPCNYDINSNSTSNELDEFDEFEELPRWSDRAIGNLTTQARFRTDAERLDPTLINTPEYSPGKQRRYDQDIQSNLSGLRKSIDTGGGTTQQKLFQNLSAFDNATTQVGRRQKQTEDYNINILNQAAQIAANLELTTDTRNAEKIYNSEIFNANAANTETAAENAKKQYINLAKTDAQNEQLQKAMYNFNNPNFPISYKDGMPIYRSMYRDPNPTKGQQDIVSTYQDILSKIGDSDKNKQIALDLAKSKFVQVGGYVSANDMYPFFNE